jgi:hypothetical protein
MLRVSHRVIQSCLKSRFLPDFENSPNIDPLVPTRVEI